MPAAPGRLTGRGQPQQRRQKRHDSSGQGAAGVPGAASSACGTVHAANGGTSWTAAPCVCATRGSRAVCPHLPSRTSRLSCCELPSLRWPARAVLRSGGAGFTHLIHKRGVVDGGPRVQPGALTGLCACAQVLRDAVLPAAPVRRGHRQAGARPRASPQRVAVAGRRRFVCRTPLYAA